MYTHKINNYYCDLPFLSGWAMCFDPRTLRASTLYSGKEKPVRTQTDKVRVLTRNYCQKEVEGRVRVQYVG